MELPISNRPRSGAARRLLVAAGVTGALLGLAMMSTADSRPRPGANARVTHPAKTPRRESQTARTAPTPQAQGGQIARPNLNAQYNPKELQIDKVHNMGDTATHEVGH